MPKDDKKKRLSKDSDGDKDTWNCTMCTFENKASAFKCAICDARKGTSTRKQAVNDHVVEKQKTMQSFVVQQQEKAVASYRKRAQQSMSPTNSRHSPVSSCSSSQSLVKPVKAKRAMIPIPDVFIYRASPKKLTVVVNGDPATITEFRRKPITNDRVAPRHRQSESKDMSPLTSSSTSETSTHETAKNPAISTK